MEHVRIARLRTKVSLVVCLVDAFTSDHPHGANISVVLEGSLSKPIVTSKGTYIFTNLQAGAYGLRVNAQHYFEERRPIEVGLENTLVHVTLSPRPSYPFKEKDTLLRVSVGNEEGQPYAKALLHASVQTEDEAKARLAQDRAEPGADELVVGSVTGVISPGDRYLIRGRGAEAGEELCRIAEVLEHRRRLKLDRPLAGSYTRGALLLPAMQTQSDEQGEAVVAFSNCRARSFNVKLDIVHGGRSLSKEVNVAEGGTTAAGRLQF
ncbi:hypothetical protein [Paenibacillus piri]|uniref:Uncharacterized protein n=1 Tax=Paenibacillus piri TaxID=2547395 RepID=A0A4R5KP93_9BACL|nr:hypothetical protein [Paenibacillus piri]TDF97122.1 hypothetical protein E1757_14890 [Paenibacillus piri]